MNDTVSQETTISAPIQAVWNVVTKLDTWFAEKAAFELVPGARGTISWSELGEAPIEVVEVDRPHTFVFSWIAPDEETRNSASSTLVTLALTEAEGGTLVRVIESGFSRLALTETEKGTLRDKHTSGWAYFVGKIRDCAEGAARNV